jgi:3-oxoadipate enol-lactonase
VATTVEHTSAIRGARIAWQETGTGPVTVYAHGLTQSRAAEAKSWVFDWSRVAASGHRLVQYDARGHGQSTGAAQPDDYTWPNLAADLLALIDELSPASPVSGIGSSMGTATLLHAATVAPGRFDKLVLTAPPTAWATRAAQGAMYDTGAEIIEQHGPDKLRELTLQAPVPEVFAGLSDYPPAPDVSTDLLPSVMRGAGKSDLPPEAVIGALDQPVLILAWAGDPGHPVSSAERLQELIRGSQLQVATSTDHLREWGAIAAGFLAS